MVKRGRKPATRKTSRLDLIVGLTQKEALAHVSSMSNLTMSSIVETALIEYLQKYYGKILEKEGICIN